MPALFSQSDFIGGLDTSLDATKTPQSSYPLLINGRTRRDIVEPTPKHLLMQDFGSSEVQGIFAAGQILIVFVAGYAYYGNLSVSPTYLIQIPGWTVMNTTGRIYAQLITSTTNFFNRNGVDPSIGLSSADLTNNVFNAAVPAVPQALFVFDGVHQPQALFINSVPRVLGTYESWTKNNPEYVPVGLLPCVQGNKLFLVLADRQRIVSSVSGRMSDFVINIDQQGEKGGDATTLALAVSYQEITSIRPLNSGQLFVTTLYASYTITLDEDNPIFGEPNLRAALAFPVGCVNDISSVDILGDTAFITQSGIQSFNSVAQMLKESNNTTFGNKIRGLLLNPQTDTCAATYDDYALFAVNTIFGRGVIVYDTTRSNFQSLDLSFGNVRQFANTRVNGSERLFFITTDNRVYEAFASDETNVTRIYVGEWSADKANQDVLIDMVDTIFTNVKTSGQCKITTYADREKKDEVVVEVTAPGYTNNYPIQIPFTPAEQVNPVGFMLTNKLRAWKVGVLIEWNFDGALSDVSLDGAQRTSDNTSMEEQTTVEPESLAFIADTGFGAELNDAAVFEVGGFKIIPVTQGSRYIYDQVSDQQLINGRQVVTAGVFTAVGPTVAVGGTAGQVPTFSLKLAEDTLSVLSAIYDDTKITAILGGGDHTYPAGTAVQTRMGLSVFNRLSFDAVAGNHDYDTSLGTNFFNRLKIPRFYNKAFNYVEFFFYNGGWTSANVPVNSSGITTGSTSEPQGNNSSSLQAQWLRNALAASTKPFKIIIVHEPPYTTDDTYYPGYADLRFLLGLGAHAVLSGHGHNMERRVTGGVPSFVCGTGGSSLRGFRAGTENIAAFRDSDHFGYLAIKADPLTCLLEFRDTENNVLDSYSLYAR